MNDRDSTEAKNVADALNRRIELHTCRQQHTALRHILAQFPQNASLSGAQMLALLERLKAVLYRHLQLEDEYVYPALSQAYDETLRATARQYRMEMGGVMRAFEDFERRWASAESIDADPDDYFEEWSALRGALELRMNAEDRGLYHRAEAYFTSVLEPPTS